MCKIELIKKIKRATYRSHIVINKMIDICVASFFSYVSPLNVREKIEMYKCLRLEKQAKERERERERKRKFMAELLANESHRQRIVSVWTWRAHKLHFLFLLLLCSSFVLCSLGRTFYGDDRAHILFPIITRLNSRQMYHLFRPTEC